MNWVILKMTNSAGRLRELAAANEALGDYDNTKIDGDVIFGGDIRKWRQLINLYRLRILINCSMKQTIAGERVGELFAGIVGDPEGNPIMGALSDSAIRDEKGNMENYKYYNDNNFVSSYRISKFVVDWMRERGDMRLPKLAEMMIKLDGKNADPTDLANYKGVIPNPGATGDNNNTDMENGSQSRLKSKWYLEPVGPSAMNIGYPEQEFILVNGRPVKSSYKVKPMDVITVMMDRPRYENEVIPEDIPLDIVYEDKYLMVVNKPAGLVVHPGHGNYHGTLVNAIAWHMKDNPDYDANDPHVGLVHRIDKDTSGLLVIAKTPDAKTNLGNQFFNKTTKRRYRALVWGNVEQDEGTVVGNIGRNPRDRMQMTVLPDDQGKHAVTHYRVLERLGYVTLVECILETGRTHQIRVHMKHIGHILFNDERYGGHEILKGTHFAKYKQFVNNCFDTCPRQALHAMTLGFVHPVTGEEMYFTSELPDDMTRLIDKWRGYISNRELE